MDDADLVVLETSITIGAGAVFLATGFLVAGFLATGFLAGTLAAGALIGFLTGVAVGFFMAIILTSLLLLCNTYCSRAKDSVGIKKHPKVRQLIVISIPISRRI
jgi:membrane protein implicated in regulation of membrane protease activity